MPIIYNSGIFGQPAQALPTDEKDELWKRANLDGMEQLLKSHLPEKQKRLENIIGRYHSETPKSRLDHLGNDYTSSKTLSSI